MSSKEAGLGETHSNTQILALASLFDAEFSIDWLQDLSSAKATTLLITLEKACQDKVLEKTDIGIFCFLNKEFKARMQAVIPKEKKEILHKKIAGIMINEAADNEQGIMSAAAQLLHVSNDLDGCRILLNAGERHRKNGRSDVSLKCYEKAIQDLEHKNGPHENTLFIKIVIGYSKNRLSLSVPEITISLLQKALEYAEEMNETSFQAIVLLHLASVEYLRMKYIPAQQYFFKGRKIAKGVSDPLVQQALDTYSVLHYCYSGRFKDAINQYESIEPGFWGKASDYRLSSYRVGLMLGVCYANIGRISQGLGMVNQLRDDALASNDHDAAVRASIYIAWVLIMKHDFETAAGLVQDALKISKKLDLFTKSLAALLLAYIYFLKNDVETSHVHLKKALKTRNKYSFSHRGYLFDFCLAMERGTYPPIKGLSLKDEIKMSNYIGNIYSQGVALRYQAIWQQDKGEPPENILKNLNRSLQLLEASGAWFEIARTKEALGRYYLQQNDIIKAKEYVEAAAKIFQKQGGGQIADDLKHLVKGFHIKEDLADEILDFGPEIMEIQDIKRVAQRILATTIRLTEAERGGIFLYPGEAEKPDFEFLAGKNLAQSDLEKNNFKRSYQMVVASGETGQVKLSNTHSFKKDLLTKDAIKSSICVPLLCRGKTIGVLYHDNRLFQSTFKQQDLKIVSYFASLAAIALDNAHAYEKINSLNQRLSEEKNYLEEQQMEHLHFEDFIAVSPAIKKVLTLVNRVADTETTVLILGETGVGKEMVARAIHHQSSRRDKPFIRVNCSSFSQSLIASELFGHEKDSFTGASKMRIGRFELADTGTLFLDEIGDISMDIQVRLLRVLQTKKFERVGASESIQSDFRLLTATNQNLEKAVAQGRFRQDLFYRLNVFPIYVPPLRERIEGIASLAEYFLKKHADKMDKSFKEIPENEMAKLMKYHWPGNVRELENVIERGVILNSEPLFTIPELAMEKGDIPIAGQISLEEMERRFIFDTVKKVNWKIHGPGGAAELLGMNHSTLYSRMKKLGIKKPDKG